MDTVFIELIKITPTILWYFFVVGLVVVFYRPIIDNILPRLKTFEAGGVKISIVSESIAAAIKFADEINGANSLKSSKWNIEIDLSAAKIVENRAQKNIKIFKGASILWVDDHPEFNHNEIRMFKQLGVDLDTAFTSEQAKRMLDNSKYDIVFSDISRGDNPQAGLKFLDELKDSRVRSKFIFYVGHLDSTNIPDGAFGITNKPNELLHLTMDVLERSKY